MQDVGFFVPKFYRSSLYSLYMYNAYNIYSQYDIRLKSALEIDISRHAYSRNN